MAVRRALPLESPPQRPAIRIRRAHPKLAEARKDAGRMAKQLKKDFDLDYGWDGHDLRFQRTSVDGQLHVTAKEIRLDARRGRFRVHGVVSQQLDDLTAEIVWSP